MGDSPAGKSFDRPIRGGEDCFVAAAAAGFFFLGFFFFFLGPAGIRGRRREGYRRYLRVPRLRLQSRRLVGSRVCLCCRSLSVRDFKRNSLSSVCTPFLTASISPSSVLGGRDAIIRLLNFKNPTFSTNFNC